METALAREHLDTATGPRLCPKYVFSVAAGILAAATHVLTTVNTYSGGEAARRTGLRRAEAATSAQAGDGDRHRFKAPMHAEKNVRGSPENFSSQNHSIHTQSEPR